MPGVGRRWKVPVTVKSGSAPDSASSPTPFFVPSPPNIRLSGDSQCCGGCEEGEAHA